MPTIRVRRITLLGDISPHLSYGQHAIEIVRGLARVANCHVSIRPTRVREEFGAKVPKDIRRLFVSGPQPEEWELLLHPPTLAPTPRKKTAYFTMHEATRLTPQAVACLNLSSLVIVPSLWNASTFSAAGVTVPIQVVPLGIHGSLFHYRPVPKDLGGICVFGTAGRTKSGGPDRKGIGDVIGAFLEAFPNEANVRLKVKCFPDCELPPVDDARVEIVRGYIEDEELADWFTGTHCFVSGARCEGWGLMQLQAMAIGRPVISVAFGGVTEFFDERVGFPISFTLEKALGPYAGQGLWAEPSRASLVQQMRTVFTNPVEAAWRGLEGSRRARRFTWDAANQKLVRVLESVGAIEKGGESKPTRVQVPFKTSSESYGILAYLPPAGVGNTEIFLCNLREQPAQKKVTFLSDHPWPEAIRIPDPTKSCGSSNSIASLVFLHAFEYAERAGLDYFIWLETDCRVGRKNWDTRVMDQWSKSPGDAIGGGNLAMFGSVKNTPLEAQFKELCDTYPVDRADKSFQRTTILLHGAPTDSPTPFVNGAPAVYSVRNLRSLLGPGTTEELLRMLPIQDLSLGHLAVLRYGLEGALSKWFHMPLIMATAGETIYPISTRMGSLQSDEVAIVHPIKGRWRPPPEGGYSFYCSGNLGDLVYALKAIKLIGGGKLVLGPVSKNAVQMKHPITRERFNAFLPLLKEAPYLTDVEFSETWRSTTYDLDDFVGLWTYRRRHPFIEIDNICEMYCFALGVHQLYDTKPWLTCPSKTVAPVIIHRSARYQATDFPWSLVLPAVRGKALFVGLPDEWTAFNKIAVIPYYGCANFLELASVIRGAKWFVGNQSFPCALAVSLGKNVFQETDKDNADCVFARDNFFNQGKLPAMNFS